MARTEHEDAIQQEEEVEVFFLLYNLLSPLWVSFGIRHGAIAVVQRTTEKVLVVHYEGWKGAWQGYGTGLKPKEYGLEKFCDGDFLWRNCIWKGLAPCGCRRLGRTKATFEQVESVVDEIKHEWPGISYHMFWRNCLHFSGYLAHRLGCETGVLGFWDVYLLPTFWGLLLYALGGFLVFDLPWWMANQLYSLFPAWHLSASQACGSMFGWWRPVTVSSESLVADCTIISEVTTPLGMDSMDVVLEMDKAAVALLSPIHPPCKMAVYPPRQAWGERPLLHAGPSLLASEASSSSSSSAISISDAVLPLSISLASPTSSIAPSELSPDASLLLEPWSVSACEAPALAAAALSCRAAMERSCSEPLATIWCQAQRISRSASCGLLAGADQEERQNIATTDVGANALIDQLLAALVEEAAAGGAQCPDWEEAETWGLAGISSGCLIDELLAVLVEEAAKEEAKRTGMAPLPATTLQGTEQQLRNSAAADVDALLDYLVAELAAEHAADSMACDMYDAAPKDRKHNGTFSAPTVNNTSVLCKAGLDAIGTMQPMEEAVAHDAELELVDVELGMPPCLPGRAPASGPVLPPRGRSDQKKLKTQHSGGRPPAHPQLPRSDSLCQPGEEWQLKRALPAQYAGVFALLQKVASARSDAGVNFSLSESALMQEANGAALLDAEVCFALSEPGLLADGPDVPWELDVQRVPAPGAAQLELVEEWRAATETYTGSEALAMRHM